MPTILPIVQGDADQAWTTDLAGVIYLVRLRWNLREAAWYLDVLERDERTPIVQGVKVVLGAMLGRRAQHPLFHDGALIARDTSGAAREATLEDMGARVELWYFTRLELAAEVLGSERP